MNFRKIFDGCYHGFIGKDPNPAVIIEQNHFGRKLWTVEIKGIQVSDNSGYNCFTLALAKTLARKKVTL